MNCSTFYNLFDAYKLLHSEESDLLEYNKFTFKFFINFLEKHRDDVVTLQTFSTYFPIFQKCGYVHKPNDVPYLDLAKSALRYLNQHRSPETAIVRDFIRDEILTQIGSIYFLYHNKDFTYDMAKLALNRFFPNCDTKRALEIAQRFYEKFIKPDPLR